MRTILSIIFFGYSLLPSAEQFTVFESKGLYGLKNSEGNVTVPAIYEEVGWSNGKEETLEDVIGIKKNGKWGLISVKNKPLSEVVYHSLEPLPNRLLKASIKGRFSNQLFFGILDSDGRVKISFNYFSIEPWEGNYLVSVYDARQIKFGLIDTEGKLLISPQYQSVRKDKTFVFAETRLGEIDLFSIEGKKLEVNVDSIQHTSRGLICYREGFVGFYEWNGKKLEDFDFKKILVDDGVVFTYPFPKWDVLKGDQKVLSIQADSLSVVNTDLWIAYNNGAHHFALADSIFRNRNYEIKAINKHHFTVKNGQSKRWSVLGRGGQTHISDYDSITGNGEVYWGIKSDVWQLHSYFGKKSNLKVSKLKPGVGHQYIAKKNRYWGIIDNLGARITSFKYDTIFPVHNHYFVRYVNQWGTISKKGAWELSPVFDEVLSFKGFSVGRKNLAYTFFSNQKTWKSTSKPIGVLKSKFLMIEDDSSRVGLLGENLNSIIPALFTEIKSVQDYFVAYTDTTCSLFDVDGALIIGPDVNIQRIEGFSENYFLVQKDGRWGFLDLQGRMRISNRYEAASTFSEGMAPIKLRGKWGFIDKEEALVVQPFYDKVSSFSGGLAIVSLDNREGLINSQGQEIVKITFRDIESTAFGNFIVFDEKGKYGLVAGNGHFLLRPAFDFIQDQGDSVLVSQNGSKGLLKYSGEELLQITYDDVQIAGEFILLKN